MSGMASEIEARIAADQGAGLGDAAPGTGDGQPPVDAPPAEASISDTQQQGGPPDTIPYARFKEVNDRLGALRGYEELQQYGYDPDSLGRLAAFEARFMADPIETWKSLSSELDLPQEVRDALDRHLGDSTSTAQPGPGAPTEGQGAPQPDVLTPEVQEAIAFVREQKEAQAAAEQNAVLDEIGSHWDEMDKQAGITTPEHIKWTFISGAAAMGGFASSQELAQMARKNLMDYRDASLGSVVQGSRQTGAPIPVPGGAPPATPPTKFSSMRDASKQVIADITAGRLPQ